MSDLKNQKARKTGYDKNTLKISDVIFVISIFIIFIVLFICILFELIFPLLLTPIIISILLIVKFIKILFPKSKITNWLEQNR